ncbi:hypothetical protein BT69DRAFT_1283267 [Atractiella rhizophila]|nr:hypothetical protein BT69DRAFT_1283267 [Atractiella rhizophila]
MLTLELIHHLEHTYSRRWDSLRTHLPELRSYKTNPAPPKLECGRLPKRLFSSSSGCLDFPLVRYLLEEKGANPNSHGGHALHQCILGRDMEGIQMMIDSGADPGLKGGRSVVLALGRGLGVDVVRFLVEGSSSSPALEGEDGGEDVEERVEGKKKRRKSAEGGRKRKRRRVEDRVKIDSGMMDVAIKVGDWDVVKYFQEKGIAPSLEAVKRLQFT